MRTPQGRAFITGVSPDFALTKMDETTHPEVDVYVEDEIARIMFEEIVAANRLQALSQCEIIPYGAASVGKALGQMLAEGRFPRKSLVFLDGDQTASAGCARCYRARMRLSVLYLNRFKDRLAGNCRKNKKESRRLCGRHRISNDGLGSSWMD